MGAITPVGNSVPEYWASLKAGKVGIGPITYFDTADYKAKLAAQVKDFNAKDHMDPKAARRMELFSQYAVAAAGEALADAGIDMNTEDAYRVGVSIGCGVGSLQRMESEEHKLVTRGPSKISPLMVPMLISNMAAGNVSIQYGDADVMLAGGTESSICPIGIAGFSALTALTFSEDPLRASIPFDKERSGFVMGEGAGVVVLESLEHALARGAHILAEVAGYGATSDAFHITSPAEDGEGAAKAMTDAMAEAGVTPKEVSYINAHGTGTHHNDLFETRAIKLALGDAAYDVPVSSTKSMIGHLLGAAGAVEFIACVKSIEDGFIHPTAGLAVADEECDLNYVPGTGIEADVDVVLTNSLGFGGHNGTLLVRKYK